MNAYNDNTNLILMLLSVYKDLKCTIRASCYSVHLSWVQVLTCVSPFIQAKTNWGLGWDENRFSHYDIRSEEALPPSITVIARVKNLGNGFESCIWGSAIPVLT